MSILAFLISFLASTAGAICGIGGGVIIKPTLDLFQMASVSTISFLSGCTVLSMSLYSVGRGLLAHDSTVDFKTGTPLALGAAIGGVFGKQLFTAVKEAASNPNMVGGVQAGCLAIITIYTLAQIDARRKEIGFIEQSCAVDEKCKICKWYQLCRGGCRRDRDYYQDGIGRNYYCAAYERFFEYAWPKLGEVYEEVIRG